MRSTNLENNITVPIWDVKDKNIYYNPDLNSFFHYFYITSSLNIGPFYIDFVARPLSMYMRFACFQLR